MIFNEKEIKGVYEIQLNPHEDDRGFFVRVYDNKLFEEAGLNKKWVQENHSLSKKKGTVRGLHFQYSPNCESKLLRAVTGEAFFVVVDLRTGSDTFGKWTSVTLSSGEKNMILIPRGCAAGMCTLTEDCNLSYKVDNYYAKNNEDSIKWDDADLAIKWPIKNPEVISERDINAQSFKEFVEKNGGINP